jgi:hypothetical protein
MLQGIAVDKPKGFDSPLAVVANSDSYSDH